jgi:hypothetical protein
VWAAIGSGFKFPFIIFAKNIDSTHSIDSLQRRGFFESADDRFGSRQWYLVQNSALCHTSSRSLNALFELCNVFPEWPPNSPDLNPIESLWGAIKRRVRWDRIQTIQTVWSEFSQESIDHLVGSFANRAKLVAEAEGRTIQPLISAGKTTVPPGYAAGVRAPPKWTDDSENHLRRLVVEHGRSWKQISRTLGEFIELECKQRCMLLFSHERLR